MAPPVPGVLYVVATPIGNLEDMSDRARRILGEVDLVLCEDTRRGSKLLSACGIRTAVESYHGDTEAGKRQRLVERLAAGASFALIADAGTPGISDPGAELVAEAAARGVQVVAVPGPDAITAALSISGLPAGQFEFLGYPPRRAAERRQYLARAATSPLTSVLFEAPHRLVACLRDLVAVAGPDQPLVVCRELTKLHEQVLRTTAGEVLAHWEANEPRGEFTLLLPPGAADRQPVPVCEDALRAAGRRLLELGVHTREAADVLAMLTGRARREIYHLLVKLRGD